jgi:hypothetical protein
MSALTGTQEVVVETRRLEITDDKWFAYEIQLGDGSFLQFSTIKQIPLDVWHTLTDALVYRAQILPPSLLSTGQEKK